MRPRLVAWADLDGPLYEMLDASRNQSGWLRDALITFVAQFDAWPDPEVKPPARQFRVALRRDKDAALVNFLTAIPIRRRAAVVRAAAWFLFGRLSVGHNLDYGRLAEAIVKEMGDRGILVRTGVPTELTEEDEEQVADFLGQFTS